MKKWITMACVISFATVGTLQATPEKGPYLGVSTMSVDPALAEHLELPVGVGLVVKQVDREGGAADVLQVNDILQKFNDQLLINHQQLSVLVRGCKPDDEVKLSIIRKGKPEEVTAKLIEKELPEMPVAGMFPRLKIEPPVMKPFTWDPNVNFNDIQKKIREQMEQHFGKFDDLDLNMDDLHQKIQKQIKSLQSNWSGNLVPMGSNVSHRYSFGTSEAVVSISEGDLNLTLSVKADDKNLVARRAGKVIFDGPVNTDEEVEKLPDDVKELFDDMSVTTSFSQLGRGPGVSSSISVLRPQKGRQNKSSTSRRQSSKSSAKSVTRNGISVTITDDDLNGASIKAVDEDGKVIYEGPYNSKEDKAQVPDNVKSVLKKHIKPKKEKKLNLL